MTIHHSTLVQGTPLAALVAAMARWKDDFKTEHDDGGLDPFWHRKSKKMVLAVVALDTGDGLTFVRACNLEVSMPSGSLCAERNAIGTALSMYPRCSRADFKGVATLSLTEGEGNLNPLPPCGVCSEWLEKIVEVQPNFRVVTFSCQDLTYVNLSSLAPLSAALKQIANASRQAPALAPPAGAAPPAGPDEEDINVPLSSASHVVINPQRPTDLNALIAQADELQRRRRLVGLLPQRGRRRCGRERRAPGLARARDQRRRRRAAQSGVRRRPRAERRPSTGVEPQTSTSPLRARARAKFRPSARCSSRASRRSSRAVSCSPTLSRLVAAISMEREAPLRRACAPSPARAGEVEHLARAPGARCARSP